MAVRIRSLVSGPVIIRLSSGRNVRLSPGQNSGDLHDAEVAGNAKVDKLTARGVIEVETIGKKAGAAGKKPKAPAGAPATAAKPARRPPRSRGRRGAVGKGNVRARPGDCPWPPASIAIRRLPCRP